MKVSASQDSMRQECPLQNLPKVTGAQVKGLRV